MNEDIKAVNYFSNVLAKTQTENASVNKTLGRKGCVCGGGVSNLSAFSVNMV